MKVTFTTFLLVIVLLAYGQNIAFPYKLKYSELKENAGKYSFNEVQSEKQILVLVISEVDIAKKKTIYDGFLLLEGNKGSIKMAKIVGNDESEYYDAAKSIFSIDLTEAVKDFEFINNDNKTTISLIKKDKTTVLHSFTVEKKTKTKDDDDSVELSKTEIQLRLQRYFTVAIFNIDGDNEQNGSKLERNALVDKNDIIHLYMDVWGKFYGPGIPTAATQDNRFQIHILLAGNQAQEYSFNALYTGEYKPELLSIFDTSKESVADATSGGQEDILNINQWHGAIKGPYTNKFEVEITKEKIEDSGKSEKIVDATIRIAKLYHVSISTGLLYSSLRNPQNIETATLANGETTLIADDPKHRGILTIMATYYPWGRSFLFPPEGRFFSFHHSRFGIQVGTQLDNNISENFFLGLSNDFARGGSLSVGIHYGRRNYVAGKPGFDFGKDVFDLPDLNVNQDWGLGFYFGVVIDTRVAIELIKSLGGNN